MSKEVLDTLYIAFKASGAQEVRSQITNLEKHLQEFSKKIASVHDKALSPALKSLNSASKKVSATLNQAHAKIISSARSAKKELGSITSIQREFNREVKKTSELGKALKDVAKGSSRISVRIGGGGGGRIKSPEEQAQAEEEKRLRAEQKANALAEKERIRNAKASYNAIMRTATTLIATAKIATKVYTREISDAQKGQSLYNKIFLTGLTNRKAVSGGIRIGQYGGTPEEFFAASQALSTSLGAMTRGDTSLIEHLGKYGIGGISPKGTPEDVINAIKERIGRGDLSKNEINALLAGLPFSESMKMSIIKGHDLFKNESREFENRQDIQQQLLQAARANFDVLKSNTDLTAEMSGFTKEVSKLISENSQYISIARKILDPAKDALLTLAGMKAVFGTGKEGTGTLVSAVKTLGVAAAALAAAVGGYKLGKWIGLDKVGEEIGEDLGHIIYGNYTTDDPKWKQANEKGWWSRLKLIGEYNRVIRHIKGNEGSWWRENIIAPASLEQVLKYKEQYKDVPSIQDAIQERLKQLAPQDNSQTNNVTNYYYYGTTSPTYAMGMAIPQANGLDIVGNAMI